MVTNGSFGIDPPPEGLRGVNWLAHRGDKDGGLPSCKTTGGTHRAPTPTCTLTQQSGLTPTALAVPVLITTPLATTYEVEVSTVALKVIIALRSAKLSSALVALVRVPFLLRVAHGFTVGSQAVKQ